MESGKINMFFSSLYINILKYTFKKHPTDEMLWGFSAIKL